MAREVAFGSVGGSEEGVRMECGAPLKVQRSGGRIGHLCLLQDRHHIVHAAEDEHILLILVWIDGKLERLPRALDLAQQVFEDLLLRGSRGYRLNLLLVFLHAQLKQIP